MASTTASSRRLRPNGAGRGTRDRLVAVAEELFATRGIDAVSVRDITEAARANTASVNYHFGSKRGLIDAIVERRAEALGRRRAELLEELEEGPTPADLRAVLGALVRPTAELAAVDPAGRFFVSFLAALGDHPELMPVLDVFEPLTDRYLRALARATPDLPDAVRVLRFAVAKDVANRVLGRRDGPLHLWVEQHGGDTDDLVERVVDILVGIFTAPVTAR